MNEDQALSILTKPMAKTPWPPTSSQDQIVQCLVLNHFMGRGFRLKPLHDPPQVPELVMVGWHTSRSRGIVALLAVRPEFMVDLSTRFFLMPAYAVRSSLDLNKETMRLECGDSDRLLAFMFTDLHNYVQPVDSVPSIDASRYPHRCFACGQPAYVGAVPTAVACSSSRCRYYERT